MRRYLLAVLFLFPLSITIAQEVTLTDSVVYIDNKPVALYYKELNETMPHYNVKLYSLNHELLIKSEVIKFDAPVHELKPFYYYELSFPAVPDTLNIYSEDEAFTLVLSKIVRDYRLITDNKLNKGAVADFKTKYPGGPALIAKVLSYETYLNNTRNFNYQVTRDRTKPVTIKNDRLIIQDGKTIGKIIPAGGFYTDPNPANIATQQSERFQVTLLNGMQIDLKQLGGGANGFYFASNQLEYGEAQYKNSLPSNKSKGWVYEYMLRRVCYLIENFAL